MTTLVTDPWAKARQARRAKVAAFVNRPLRQTGSLAQRRRDAVLRATETSHLVGDWTPLVHEAFFGMPMGTRDLDENSTREEVVDALQESAKRAEPVVSRVLQDIAARYGGKLEGFDKRIKTPGSTLRKARDDYGHLQGMDLYRRFKDVLRYTLVFHPAIYSKAVMNTLYALEEAGHEVGSGKNTWDPGDPYSALHYDLYTPDGMRWELQFHTADSYQLKDETLHLLLEEQRDPATPLERKRELHDIMTTYWDDIEIPDDVFGWGQRTTIPRP